MGHSDFNDLDGVDMDDELMATIPVSQLNAGAQTGQECPPHHSVKRKVPVQSTDDDFFSDLEDLDADDVDELLAIQAPPAGVQTDSGTAKRLCIRRPDGFDASKLKLAQQLLHDSFGHKNFRHEQEQAIQRVLHCENTLVVFPTGAGKSLCYQIPGIAFEQLDLQDGSRSAGEHGITVVVSPLLALMKDQVDALKRKGISAECLDSTKTWEEIVEVNAKMRRGELRLLYCAPERLNNEGFVETVKHVRGGIRLVAIDEAHCISEWGHSFRPEYLKVARFVDEIKAERVVCLTATATDKVVDDICANFKIQKECVYRTSPYRPNLNLYVQAVKTKKDKFRPMYDFLEKNPGPGIVYVSLQQQAVSTAEDLRRHGFDAAAFHAGMKTEEKKKIQEDFMAGTTRIICATIAFGMGIDKADIRTVLHFDLPSTIEEYSQQVGRAGRDGKPSNCMFYICHEDWYLRENFARGDLPSRSSLRRLLKDIFNDDVTPLGIDGVFMTSHHVQTKQFDIRVSPLATIYAALELRFGLIRAITPQYSEYKFTATSSYYPIMKKDASREGKAVFKHAAKGKTANARFLHVNVNQVVDSTGLRRADVVLKLNKLHDSGVIELKAGGVQPRYRVLAKLPSTDAELDVLTGELYADLQRRESDAIARVQGVWDFVTGDRCFARALADHFGMGLPEGKEACGHCTYCETGKRVELPPKSAVRTDMDGINKVLAACNVRDDPRLLARVAFGIKSPRVTQLKMDRSPAFMSLADHDFQSLLKEFTDACVKAGYKE